jgi:glycosyltransferase involved in cell wall biosynthesis
VTSPGPRRTGSVLLITRYFPPLDGIATMRMLSWATHLTAMGWHVSVLTTTKAGQVVTPIDADLSSFEVTELDYFDPLTKVGFDKRAFVSTASGGGSSLRSRFRARAVRFYRERMNERMPGRTDPWIVPARRELRRRARQGITYDVVISSYGPPAAHVIGRYAQRVLGATWVADYRDLWVESHVYRGVWPFTLAERAVEAATVRHADLVTTVSTGLAQTLQGKFPQTPVLVIENGFDRASMDDAPSTFFDDRPPRFRIAYTGSVYPQRQDLSPLFRALRRLLDDGRVAPGSVEILFYGSSPGNAVDLARQHGLADVVSHEGTVPPATSHAVQRSADLLLFVEADEPAEKGVLTGKLFEYLYVDTPILGIGIGAETAAGRVVLRAGAGVVCGDDVTAVEDALLGFMNGSLEVRRDRAYIESFSREALAGRLSAAMLSARARSRPVGDQAVDTRLRSTGTEK